MSSNITPNLEPTKDLGKFKFWCQKVLPLVYDDAISYYEVLCKVVDYLNTVIDNVNTDADNINELADDFLELQTYVNNFFADIDQLASYATRAETAATAASASAVTAATQAGNAASSAGSAASSASNSASSALTALGAETDAIAAKNAAESAASAAGTSETNAGNSATAAAGSATAAAGSATDAASSATAAAGSATSAAGYADSADHFKDGANAAALKAEGNAVGKQNDVAVDSDSPYYHNNAKYYAELAASVVEGADGAKAQAMIATEETTSTAEFNHEKGTYFRLDGTLYQADEDIAIDDEITVGTNCHVAVLSDDVAENTSDIENLKNEVSASFEDKEINNVAIASFSDGADGVAIKNMKMSIKPVQSGSGTPSPTNVRNITGFTKATIKRMSKNLYDPSIIVFSLDSNGEFTCGAGTGYTYIETGQSGSAAVITPENYNKLIGLPAGKYIGYVKVTNSSTIANIGALRAIDPVTRVGSVIVSFSQDANGDCYFEFTLQSYTKVALRLAQAELKYKNIMIAPYSLGATYEAYNAKKYEINFPADANTVYGGTLENTSGDEWKLTVNYRGVRITPELVSSESWGTNWNSSRMRYLVPDMLPIYETYSANNDYYLCNILGKNTSDSMYVKFSESNDGINAYILFYGVTGIEGVSSLETWNTYLSENTVFVTYLLSENLRTVYTFNSETIKTLLGDNNILSDTGDIIKLVYRAENTTTNKINLVKSIIAKTLDAMIADTALNPNDFRIVDNILYRITDNILANATLIPGTNCTPTTVCAEITALLNS